MKKSRDFLIIVVLSGVVICVLLHFASSVHQANLNQSPVIRKGEIACIEDGMLCHVGYDTFQSEQDAQAYLKSSGHVEAVAKREEQSKDQDEQLQKTLRGVTKSRIAK